MTMRNAAVTVHLDWTKSPPFWFTTNDLKLDPPYHLYFKNGNKDGFKVDFVLDDPTGAYTFGTDSDEALYSSSSTGCPTLKAQWKEFTAFPIKDPLKLTVHNKNSFATDFGYALRVTNDGINYRDLDPIGTNQNSNGTGFSMVTAVAFFGVGAAVGAFAAKSALPAATPVSVIGFAVLGGAILLGIYALTQRARGG